MSVLFLFVSYLIYEVIAYVSKNQLYKTTGWKKKKRKKKRHKKKFVMVVGARVEVVETVGRWLKMVRVVKTLD